MISRILSSLKFRAKMAHFGVYYLSADSFNLSKIRIGRRYVTLSLPASEKRVLEYELGKILFEDCYKLGTLDDQIKTVLDIGANVGLFAMAARHYFPKAKINMYEPNAELETHLKQHCCAIDAAYFLEAVGARAGIINLETRENSLHSVAREDCSGTVPRVSFREAIERMGGSVDLLKLDCEGAEWAIFKDIESWQKVRHLTMEYHLWAEPGYSLNDVFNSLERIGFRCWKHSPSPSGQFGLIQASRQ